MAKRADQIKVGLTLDARDLAQQVKQAISEVAAEISSAVAGLAAGAAREVAGAAQRGVGGKGAHPPGSTGTYDPHDVGDSPWVLRLKYKQADITRRFRLRKKLPADLIPDQDPTPVGLTIADLEMQEARSVARDFRTGKRLIRRHRSSVRELERMASEGGVQLDTSAIRSRLKKLRSAVMKDKHGEAMAWSDALDAMIGRTRSDLRWQLRTTGRAVSASEAVDLGLLDVNQRLKKLEKLGISAPESVSDLMAEVEAIRSGSVKRTGRFRFLKKKVSYDISDTLEKQKQEEQEKKKQAEQEKKKAEQEKKQAEQERKKAEQERKREESSKVAAAKAAASARIQKAILGASARRLTSEGGDLPESYKRFVELADRVIAGESVSLDELSVQRVSAQADISDAKERLKSIKASAGKSPEELERDSAKKAEARRAEEERRMYSAREMRVTLRRRLHELQQLPKGEERAEIERKAAEVTEHLDAGRIRSARIALRDLGVSLEAFTTKVRAANKESKEAAKPTRRFGAGWGRIIGGPTIASMFGMSLRHPEFLPFAAMAAMLRASGPIAGGVAGGVADAATSSASSVMSALRSVPKALARGAGGVRSAFSHLGRGADAAIGHVEKIATATGSLIMSRIQPALVAGQVMAGKFATGAKKAMGGLADMALRPIWVQAAMSGAGRFASALGGALYSPFQPAVAWGIDKWASLSARFRRRPAGEDADAAMAAAEPGFLRRRADAIRAFFSRGSGGGPPVGGDVGGGAAGGGGGGIPSAGAGLLGSKIAGIGMLPALGAMAIIGIGAHGYRKIEEANALKDRLFPTLGRYSLDLGSMPFGRADEAIRARGFSLFKAMAGRGIGMGPTEAAQFLDAISASFYNPMNFFGSDFGIVNTARSMRAYGFSTSAVGALGSLAARGLIATHPGGARRGMHDSPAEYLRLLARGAHATGVSSDLFSSNLFGLVEALGQRGMYGGDIMKNAALAMTAIGQQFSPDVRGGFTAASRAVGGMLSDVATTRQSLLTPFAGLGQAAALAEAVRRAPAGDLRALIRATEGIGAPDISRALGAISPEAADLYTMSLGVSGADAERARAGLGRGAVMSPFERIHAAALPYASAMEGAIAFGRAEGEELRMSLVRLKEVIDDVATGLAKIPRSIGTLGG